jgi:hypothetical protein
VVENFYFLVTILGLRCSCDQMRHEFAPEAEMSIFHVEQSRGNLAGRSAGRLPMGQAALAIGGLSALCWVIVLIIALGVRALI